MATNSRKYPCPTCGAMRYGSPEQVCATCLKTAAIIESIFAPLGPWIYDGLCGQTDPEVFFPRHYGGTDKSAAMAKAICAKCPVKNECLEWSLEAGELWGVWGGMDELERRKRLGIKGVRGATAA